MPSFASDPPSKKIEPRPGPRVIELGDGRPLPPKKVRPLPEADEPLPGEAPPAEPVREGGKS